MMETTTVTDCLVLKIEERETDVELLDTTIYVIYDKKERNYVVRGKRRVINDIDSCTYSFVCKDHRDLADFLSFVVCKENLWTYVLYNYDNLPYDSNDITYEFLKEYESNVYELTGYNNLDYSRKGLCSILRMLRNVFNYYN
jgi:hypothetical protein